jgi:phosphoribosylglycinamide formyltransferase-1
MIRIGILGSTRGTNLDAIVNAIRQKHLSASVEIVISNKSDAGILERARSFGLAVKHVDAAGLSREEYDRHLTSVLSTHAVDLVVLIGFMRILSSEFINAWHGRIINVHPSLLPAYAGMMDLNVHRAVLESGDMETGCTVHFVTEQVDAGPIILQKKCRVFPGDTPDMLKQRVQLLEGDALVDAISEIANAKTA